MTERAHAIYIREDDPLYQQREGMVFLLKQFGEVFGWEVHTNEYHNWDLTTPEHLKRTGKPFIEFGIAIRMK